MIVIPLNKAVQT